MSTVKCSSCGRQIKAGTRCGTCGAEPPGGPEDLARIERSIAEMKERDLAIAKEQKQIAAKMQAALFQRDILAHASEQRRKQATKPRRVLRRKAGQRPPTATPAATVPPRVPRQGKTATQDRTAPPPPGPRPPGGARRDPDREPPREWHPDDDWQPEESWHPAASADHPPEASSREVQNILLGLAALVLGVAAIVFVVAISSLGDVGRVSILLAATVLMLAAPPVIARRRLTSTAETVATVGLLLVPLVGYAMWTVDRVWMSGLPGATFGAIVCLVTVGVAIAYAGATGLGAPRYAAVLAGQPVIPLFGYEWISDPTGWAVALTLVAVADLYLGSLLARGRLMPGPAVAPAGPTPGPVTDPARPGRPDTDPDRDDAGTGTGKGTRTGPGNGDSGRAGTGSATGPDGADRPESAPEEADAVLTVGAAGRARPAPAPAGPTAPWLGGLIGALYGIAVLTALGFAVVALLDVDALLPAVRAGLALLFAAAVGLVGALAMRQPALIDIAAGVMTLAVIGAVGRVAAIALPGQSLLLIAAVIALTGLGVRAVPEVARRGPQLASAAALVVIGIVVSGSALRAAAAPVRAAMPVWDADLASYPGTLAASVGATTWQLAATAFLLTIAAVLSVPQEVRREFAVVGAALTALALPASFGLAWTAAPWPPVLAAIGIAVAGLSAQTRRAALAHAAGAAVVGLVGAGASVARPGLNAAVLLTLTAAGVLVAVAARLRPAEPDGIAGGEAPAGSLIADWATGGAAFAFPGAVAAFVAAAIPIDPTPTAGSIREATEPVLAASFLAVCVTVCYSAMTQVAQRHISAPLAVGTGFGALAVTAAAFGAPGATLTDVWVAALLMVAAVLLFLAPSIDAGRRADRLLDGSDFAAAAATAALVGTLARVATILVPGAEIAAAALLILVVAVAIRTAPYEWRRGPILGVTLSGGVVALIAGYTALRGGLQVLATPGRIWAADLNAWPSGPTDGAWQAPVALVLLALAAGIVLPRPWGYDVAAVCVGLATIGTPAALGLPWWSPIVVGGAVATGYGVAAVAAADPRAGLARASVAAAVALHAVGASLVRPWTTAAALGVVALVGVVVATLGRVLATLDVVPNPGLAGADPHRTGPDPHRTGVDPRIVGVDGPADGVTPLPAHLAQIGGAATGGALLALPGALAALAVELGWPAEVVLGSALAGSSLGLALLAIVRQQIPQYLSYATVGVAGGATATALAALPTDLPWGIYAAAAALLGILAELIRSATPPPGVPVEPARRWSARLGGPLRRLPDPRLSGRWSVSPTVGAMAAAALPTVLAVAAVAPALVAALVDPYRTLGRIWAGPPEALANPPVEAINGSNVLASLLLTVAAALAATGFSGGRPARAVPVVLPGAAITLLIAPASIGLGWPTSTMAALGVFVIAMLGLALTPPPPPAERSRPLRVARVLAFAIGLAAFGAGLAGSLATQSLTLFTLAGAVFVGAVAALFGRTQAARILGWLFASIMAQLTVLTTGLVLGLAPVWSAFGVLAVGAALLLGSTTLPRLRHADAGREAATVEWSGHAAALIAGALAYDSPRHIAALLAAWGAVLGVAATRRGRGPVERRTLFWLAVACEISAWWLLMWLADVALPEAYTLPFAALALLVGVLELRHRPDLSSWVAYGPALVAALLPTMVIVVFGDGGNVRQVFLLLGGVATLIVGSTWQQQAPVIIGSVVTVVATLTLLTAFGPWLVLIPVGIVLLVLGASNESRRRTQEWNRVVRGMR